jgi:hypothetical protein
VLVFCFRGRYILHFFAPKKRQNSCPDYLVLVLRQALTKRKIAGGSRSFPSFVDTTSLLTVIQSCRTQGRSVLTFFRQVLVSLHRPLDKVVSLIPTADFFPSVNPQT